MKSKSQIFSFLTSLCAVAIFFMGCTAAPLREARQEFYNNQVIKAANTLSEAKRFPKRDNLLLFMEKGLILHYGGNYKESIRELRKASKLIEEQEVISISQQTASLVTTEWITDYKGEYSERLWVHTYLMMNYLLIYQYDDALVEAKQALKILEKHPDSLSNDYFTRAMIALCYENLREINDAYIEYKKLATLMRNPVPIASSLYRLGSQLGFTKEAEYYKKFIPRAEASLSGKHSPAELILFVGTGSGPVKIPGNIILPPSIRFSFPQYQERRTSSSEITVLGSNGERLHTIAITSNLNAIAKASLQDRAAKIMAKETARAAAKEAIAHAVERKNKNIVGVLLRAAFFLMEEPDTRCWETLPAFLNLLRIPISPGTHQIRIITYGKGGTEDVLLPEMRVSSGERLYYSVRVND